MCCRERDWKEETERFQKFYFRSPKDFYVLQSDAEAENLFKGCSIFNFSSENCFFDDFQ